MPEHDAHLMDATVLDEWNHRRVDNPAIEFRPGHTTTTSACSAGMMIRARFELATAGEALVIAAQALLQTLLAGGGAGV